MNQPVPPSTNLQDAFQVISLLQSAATSLQSCTYRRGSCIHLPAVGTLLVSGDLHDNPINLRKIIQLAKLNDDSDSHVLFQEMIHGEYLVNGVDLSYRMLLRVAELVVKYPQQVHPVLANHEIAQLTGRGVSKGAGNSVELFNAGLEFVFSDRSEDVHEAICEFIRAMPLAVRSDSGVFCAHSLPGPLQMKLFDASVLNRELNDADYEHGTGAASLLTWGRRHTKEQIAKLVEEWGVRLFCLGHEHVDTGCEMFGPNLVKLNSDHEGGAVLGIDLADPPTEEEAMMSAIRLGGLG